MEKWIRLFVTPSFEIIIIIKKLNVLTTEVTEHGIMAKLGVSVARNDD